MMRVASALLIVCLVLVAYQNCGDLDAPSGLNGFSSVDDVPPDIFINRAPPVVTAATAVTFEFVSTDTNASFECAINGGEFEACSSPKTYNNLPDGNYRVAIRARDKAGNFSDTGNHSFQVNRAALTVQISTSIPAYTNQRNFSIAFAKGNPSALSSGFECKIDLLDYVACTSPFDVSNLNEGDHAVQVRAKANDGSFSAVAVLQWRVDLTLPVVNISTGPLGAVTINNTATAAANFAFTVQDVGGSQVKTITCQIDNGAETNCNCQQNSCTMSYQITGNGAIHNFVVRASDNAGNQSAVTRTFSYTSHYDPPPPPPGDGGGGDGGAGGAE